MLDHELLKESLNNDARIILTLIKEDYYSFMSDEKRRVLDELLASPEIVIVDKGLRGPDDNTLAHGGRGKKDGKIHYYPDSRHFDSDTEMIEKCRSILPHEIFHYFLQPDAIKLRRGPEREMANYYTEGLVEKETRKFIARHPEIPYDKANYGYNINFVNMLQRRLNADSNEVMYSESDYLKDIGQYLGTYIFVRHSQESMSKAIDEISEEVPENMRDRFRKKAKSMIDKEGNAGELIGKLKSLRLVSEESLRSLEKQDRFAMGKATPKDLVLDLDELYSKSILLIGPSGAGKSAVADELSKETGMRRLCLDAIANRARAEGFTKNFRSQEEYVDFMLRNVLQEAMIKGEPGVVDFGAGHSVFDDQERFRQIKELLSQFKNIVLLLPSPDIETSLDILAKRSTGDYSTNEKFIKSPCNRELATMVIYENGRTPKEVADSILKMIAEREQKAPNQSMKE